MLPVHEFIGELTRFAVTPQRAFADVLWARGFLIEIDRGALILSDNAHRNDFYCLHDQLARTNHGGLDGNRLDIGSDVLPHDLAPLFSDFGGGCEAFYAGWWSSWRNFRNRVHGPKVPIDRLDPFVAALVKAMNAVGLGTYSCGDAHGRNELNVSLSGVYHGAWFEVLLDVFLREHLFLACEWRMDRERCWLYVRHPHGDVVQLFIEAVSAAKTLYDQRVMLRQLKQKVGGTLDSRVHEMSTYEDAYRLMRQEVLRQNTSAPPAQPR
jgi:hypothetical protein